MLKALIFIIFCFISLSVFAQNQTLPSPEFFKGWQPVTGYTTSNVNIDTLPKLTLNCNADATSLYATHPQQETKHYHRFNWGTYSGNVPAESPACTLPSRFKAVDGKYYCQRVDIAYDVIISDIYRDRCGNLYRGFWQIIYLKQNENMGTLFSKGRTVYPNTKSGFPGDVYVGHTYPVRISDFLFLSPIFSDDLNRSAKTKSRALSSTHVFDEKTLLFSLKP